MNQEIRYASSVVRDFAGDRLARHAHLPLQSGSDSVLRRMHRRYRPWHYAEKVAEFRERLNAYASAVLTPEDLLPTVEVDATLDFAELTEKAIGDVFALGPFGCGNSAPVGMARGAWW